jgi:hypothetical protein
MTITYFMSEFDTESDCLYQWTATQALGSAYTAVYNCKSPYFAIQMNE